MSQNNQPSWTGRTVLAEAPGGGSIPVIVGQRLGAGGEGVVFQDATRPTYVLKIMHSPTTLSESKTRGMLASPPAEQLGRYQGNEYVQIAWPQELLVDNTGAYIGFSMRYLDMSLTVGLEAWTNRRERRLNKLSENDRLRVHLAANLASVTNYVNQAGHALIDLKPANVLAFRQNGHVCLVDCDGFRIQANGTVFPASAYTPNYLAPEFHSGTGGPALCGEEQDQFALAVVIYQLFDNGIHPFSGIGVRGGGVSNGVAPMIVQRRTFLDPSSGLSAHKRSHHLFFPDDTLHLFLRAFTGPADQRPTSAEWKAHLFDVARNRMQPCSTSVDHWGFGKGCPWCASPQIQIPPPRATSPHQGFPSASRPSYQPISQPVSQPPSQPVSQPVSQPGSQPISQPAWQFSPQQSSPSPGAGWSQPGQTNAVWFKQRWKPAAGLTVITLIAGIAFASIRKTYALDERRTQYANLVRDASKLHSEVNSPQVPARIRPNLQSLEGGIQGSLSSAQRALAEKDLKTADQSLSLASTTISSLEGFLHKLPSEPPPPNPLPKLTSSTKDVQDLLFQTRTRLSQDNLLLSSLSHGAFIPGEVRNIQAKSQQTVDSAAADLARSEVKQARTALADASGELTQYESQIRQMQMSQGSRSVNDGSGSQESTQGQGSQSREATIDTRTTVVPTVSDQTRTRYRDLRDRAAVVKRALQPIEAAQAASGYGLRNDMAGAEVRMQGGLRDASQAINSGRDDEAQRSLDSVEKAIEQLEKFLSIG